MGRLLVEEKFGEITKESSTQLNMGLSYVKFGANQSNFRNRQLSITHLGIGGVDGTLAVPTVGDFSYDGVVYTSESLLLRSYSVVEVEGIYKGINTGELLTKEKYYVSADRTKVIVKADSAWVYMLLSTPLPTRVQLDETVTSQYISAFYDGGSYETTLLLGQTDEDTLLDGVSGVTEIPRTTLAQEGIYCIYCVKDNTGGVGLVGSLNHTAPVGFTTYRRVGRFNVDSGLSIIIVAKAKLDEIENVDIGKQISACVDEVTFQTIHGVEWIQIKGQDVSGSKYNELTGVATLPNTQGKFLRGSGGTGNNVGPNLGVAQGDSTKQPNSAFSAQNAGGHSHTLSLTIFRGDGIGGNGWGGDNLADVGGSTRTVSSHGGHPHNIGGGDVETRPANIGVNFFIKIN